MSDFAGNIQPLTGPGSGLQRPGGIGPSSEPDRTFTDLLKEQIAKVDLAQKEAGMAVENLVTGKTDSVTEVMAAVEKAGIAFKMLMQIRNKLMEAYREVSRMQV